MLVVSVVKITTESGGDFCLLGGVIIRGGFFDIKDIGASSENRGSFCCG